MAIKWQHVLDKYLGGIRTDLAEFAQEQETAREARNCRINKLGEIRRRSGFSKINEDGTGICKSGINDNITGLYQLVKSNGNDYVIECVDEYIMKENFSSANTELKSGQTTDNYYCFETYLDNAIIVNGVDRPLKYDGSDITNLSIDPPVVGSMAANAIAGGTLDDGVYYYCVTFYNSTTGEESNPYLLSTAPYAACSGGNNQINLTDIPISSDPQVDGRYIYRTTALPTGSGVPTKFFLQGEITDNTSTYPVGTPYLDNVNDTGLGLLIELDHDTAPDFTKMVLHKERLFGFEENSSALYYGNISKLGYFPRNQLGLSFTPANYTAGKNNIIYVGQDDGDKITNIVSFYDRLLIFKENNVYALYGFDESDFYVKKIEYTERIGCVSKRGAVVKDNFCYFIDKSGIYRTNGNTIDEDFKEAVREFFNFDGDGLYKIDSSEIDNSIAIIENTRPNDLIKFYFTMPNSSNYKINGLGLIFHTKTQQWSYDTGYLAKSVGVYESSSVDYMLRGDDYGYVWIHKQTNLGDGAEYYQSEGDNITSTNNTITDEIDTIADDLLVGSYIEVEDPNGVTQKRLITAHTYNSGTGVTELTVDENWDTNPDDTYIYYIGGIDYVYQHRWNDYGDSIMTKRQKFIKVRVISSGTKPPTFGLFYDFAKEASLEITPSYIISSASWGEGEWNNFVWGGISILDKYIPAPQNKIHNRFSIGIKCKIPGQQYTFYNYDTLFQVKGFGIR
jgi:hypothetical protein